jgi:hypothetical protein
MFTTEKETTQVQQSGRCAELMESNPSSAVGLHTMCSTAAVDGSSGRISTPFLFSLILRKDQLLPHLVQMTKP